MDVQADVPGLAVDASRLVDALAVAWNTFLLYPDPVPQVPFQRAMDEMKDCILPAHLEIGPGHFIVDGEAVERQRDGAERLATRLFLHDVGRLRIVTPPHPSDLVQLFRLVEDGEEAVARRGGVIHLLTVEGVTAIKLDHRTLVVGRRDDGLSPAVEPARDHRVREVLDDIGTPEGLAARVQDPRPGRVATSFLDWFRDTYARLEADDIGGRESVVALFVEAFFYLDSAAQADTVELLLGARNDPWARVFLDQFSGHDLLSLAADLSEGHFQHLLDYARLAADDEGSRPRELVGLLQSAQDVKLAHRVVVGRIQDLLGDAGRESVETADALAALRAQAPAPESFFNTGRDIFRELVRVETRPPRLRRVLRIWVGKVAAGVRSGDFEFANSWLGVLLAGKPLSESMRPELDEVLVVLARPEMIAAVATALADPSQRAEVIDYLGLWGRHAAPELLQALAQEPDQARRRRLVDLLVEVARIDPLPLLAVPCEDPWYLARNMAGILSHSPHPEAGARLRELAHHEEPRVRVEAVRALGNHFENPDVLPAVLEALWDPEERVRSAALGVLPRTASETADVELVAMLDRSRSPAEQSRVVAMLAERQSEPGLGALRRLARKRFVLSRDKRALRAAARQALWMPHE